MPPGPPSADEDASFSPLPTGRHGLAPQVVAEHQRSRIVQAMVQMVVEQGFHKVTITGLCKRARVTERAFYAQFEDLEQCFLAAYDSILESYGGDVLRASRAQLPWDQLLKGAVGALLQTTADHPEQAHLVLVDALAAGSVGIKRNRQLTDQFQALFAAHADGAPGPNRVSGLILRGLVGGVRDVVYNRVASSSTEELPRLLDSLFEWVLSYLSDAPLELARARRARRRPAAAPAPASPPLTGHGYPREYVRENQRRRLMDAVAVISRERGYGGLTVSGIARRARVSHQTFYDHFSDRGEAFVATYQQDAQDTFAFAAEAYLANQHDWPRAVHAGLERLLDWLAARPDHAHLGFVGFLAAGGEAYPIRYEALQTFAALLSPGYDQSREVPVIAGEAIAGGVFEIIAEEVLRGRAERLTEILPLITYITLAPFVGPEEAVRIGQEQPLAVGSEPTAGRASVAHSS
jgi:AcrR family transcriptional regulator